MSIISNNKKTKAKYVIPLLVLIFIGNLSNIFMLNLVEYQSIDKLNSYNNDLRDIHPKSQGIIQDDYTIEWLDNPTFETPITPWYNTTEGDASDINATTDFNQANYKILGESREKEVLLNTATQSNWKAFLKSDLEIVPQRASVPYYGVDDDGAWCSHWWYEGESGGQPKNTPRMHWKTNVSMPVDMSDYIITSLSFNAIINASVDRNIDVEGDTYARWSPSTVNINQFQTYDYAQFYVEVSTLDIDELNTYRIAFNQTRVLGNDSLSLYDIEGYLGTYGEQAIIDAINNVLAVDSGHNNFTIVLGIYMYCEDNYSGTDRDHWDDLRFKFLNLTFSYQKKIDKFTSLTWNQEGDTISGSNIDIKNATLNFKYKIDKNWTTSSPNSEFRVYINNRSHTETVKLLNANTTFQDIKIGGFDVTNLILKNVNITLSIQLYLADTFPIDQEFTLSIDNASLLISYTESIVEEETRMDLFLNSFNKTLEKSIEVTMGDFVNITAIYENTSNYFISNALVQLIGIGSPKNLTENFGLKHYNITINTYDLDLGNNYLTLQASKKYYESISIMLNIEVLERNTELQLFLDGNNKTLDKSISMIYGNDGNITITYKDIEEITKVHIDGANVELIGLDTPQNLNEDILLEQYYIIIDTKELGLGNTFLTVNAQKENYTTQSIRFKIEVLERNSYIDKIILNGIESTIIEIPWDEALNIAITYNDSYTHNFIDGALVQLSGTGISKNFTENSPVNYYVDINTRDLKLGVNFLTISAQKENYTLSSNIISISVVERTTYLDIYLNSSIYDPAEFYNISIGEQLNITVFYKDFNSGSFIDSALVQLIESGIPENLTEDLIYNQYNLIISAEDLGAGVKFLTISANKNNYTLSSEIITLIINEKKTELLLFLNGTQYFDGDTIQVEVTDILNITVIFRDNITKSFLSGATVDLLGIKDLTESITFEHYYTFIDIIDLGKTLNRINVRAQLENYQLGLIEFFIEVIERVSNGTLFLNNEDKTSDPITEVVIGTLLNITLKYYDGTTGEHIPEATIQLGGDLTYYLTENIALDQYTIIVNTSQLGLGFSIFTVVADRPNFQMFVIQKLYVNVRRISTNITTLSGDRSFLIRPGEDFQLKIVLTDLDFDETILGASVTYNWEFGQGTLTDANNDGVYEATLTNILEGSYTITINVYKGDEYAFESFEIVISASVPPEELFLFQLLLIIAIIGGVGIASYLYAYQKLLKYPKSVRKVRKYRKTLRKTRDPRTDIIEREKAFKVEYKTELDKTSKLLKGKPVEPIIKPEKILKKPVEGSNN